MSSRFFYSSVVALVATSVVWSADSTNSSGNQSDTSSNNSMRGLATDPSYRLSPGDTIAIAVQGEADMNTVQTISRSGDVRVVYIDRDVQIKDKTVRDAERYLEDLYKEKKVLKRPVVNLTITSYSPREVSVMGEVRSPGTFTFPRDLTSMDVVEVISKVGGFTNMAKKSAVVVTHRGVDGKETSQTLDLENAISGRRTQGPDRADVLIYPGDRIFVPIRYF